MSKRLTISVAIILINTLSPIPGQTDQIQTPDKQALLKKTDPLPTKTLYQTQSDPLEIGDRKKLGHPILPPFGLRWGENPETILKWSEQRGYRKKEYQDVEKRIIEVSGPFQNAEFETIRFHFLSDELEEVELQFPSAFSQTEGLHQMSKIKTALEKERRLRGSGKLQPEERGQEGDAYWRINRYTWLGEQGSIWLVNFQIKQQTIQNHYDTVAIISLHYRRSPKAPE